MKQQNTRYPKQYQVIHQATQARGFDQLSDSKVGSLLATVAATKPRGQFLELGTGSGLSTCWLLAGMCVESRLVTIDNDAALVDIASQHLGTDARVQFIVGEGEDLINSTARASVDFIFADTWPGKYNHLEETLALLKPGGVYIVDDMLPQENWPEGHAEKVDALMSTLENRDDLLCTNIAWSTGIIICTKIR